MTLTISFILTEERILLWSQLTFFIFSFLLVRVCVSCRSGLSGRFNPVMFDQPTYKNIGI